MYIWSSCSYTTSSVLHHSDFKGLSFFVLVPQFWRYGSVTDGQGTTVCTGDVHLLEPVF